MLNQRSQTFAWSIKQPLTFWYLKRMFERYPIHFLGEGLFEYWFSYCFRVKVVKKSSSVTYPEIRRCTLISHQRYRISRERSGISFNRCDYLQRCRFLVRVTVFPAIDELDFRETWCISKSKFQSMYHFCSAHKPASSIRWIDFAQIQEFVWAFTCRSRSWLTWNDC